jgi:hypothetical protein
MPLPIVKTTGCNGLIREAARVFLAMSTAAGTVYTSVRSALSDHESRLGMLESRQSSVEQKMVPRDEIEAHWTFISGQLERIEQDVRDIWLIQNGANRRSINSPR